MNVGAPDSRSGGLCASLSGLCAAPPRGEPGTRTCESIPAPDAAFPRRTQIASPKRQGRSTSPVQTRSPSLLMRPPPPGGPHCPLRTGHAGSVSPNAPAPRLRASLVQTPSSLESLRSWSRVPALGLPSPEQPPVPSAPHSGVSVAGRGHALAGGARRRGLEPPPCGQSRPVRTVSVSPFGHVSFSFC